MFNELELQIIIIIIITMQIIYISLLVVGWYGFFYGRWQSICFPVKPVSCSGLFAVCNTLEFVWQIIE